MTAKEMFKELGYEEVEGFLSIKKIYRKLYKFYDTWEEIEEEVKETGKIKFLYIEFIDLLGAEVNLSLVEVEAKIVKDDIICEEDGEIVKIGCQNLSVEELQAIQQQCKELGWR